MDNKREYKVTKIEKGHFRVEYRDAPWGVWHMVEKRFKSITQANEYIAWQ